MQRNVNTTITFSSGQVSISVIEKLSTNIVEIFNDYSSIVKVNSFIETSLSHIEKLIGGKVLKASFVIDPSLKVDHKITLSKEMIKIAGSTVSKIDVENLIHIIKQKHITNNRRVILVQPIKFDVKDIMTKSYSRAPIHKPGDILTTTATITTISVATYEYIQQVAKAAGLKINQIMLSHQTVTFANLSRNALTTGAVHININNSQVSITINKNNSIVSSMLLYDYGFKYLIKGVMNKFGCSKEKAIDLVTAHASVKLKTKRIIYSHQIGIDTHSYTNDDLLNIIQKYLYKMLALIKKYLSQKRIENLPIVFSGLLSNAKGLTEFIVKHMNSEKVSIYKPLSFIEINKNNTNGLGVSNFNEIIDEVLGRQLDTIVQTNPNLLKTLRKTKEKSNWFTTIKNKIGRKYEWN